MKSIPFVLIGVLGLAGCASVPLPPEAATARLVPISSATVEVYRPRFRMTGGELKLEAYALRQFKAETTANTHIDIVYLAASGRQLGQEQTTFSPRSLPTSYRLPKPHAYFLTSIKIPANTAVIEVRAHEGAHDR